MYINYSTFVRLYNEAEEEKDLDMYIAMRGWQDDWMCDSTEDVVAALREIHEIAQSDFKRIREILGMSQAEMIRAYDIPVRTLKSWEYGEREPADYVRKLISYAAVMEALNAEGEDDDIEAQD